MTSFHPTVWRSCRTLANRRRLDCLRAVLASPGATVGEVAAAAGLPQDQASLCLRALQARGLLRGERVSRWVRYHASPDPLVPSAAPLLAAVGHALRGARQKNERVIRSLTAFTHPRRVAIVRALQRSRGMEFSALARAEKMSDAALCRHLQKLRDRRVVDEKEGRWTLLPASDPLVGGLLALLSETPGA